MSKTYSTPTASAKSKSASRAQNVYIIVISGEAARFAAKLGERWNMSPADAAALAIELAMIES